VTWLYLIVAIASEVAATMSLRASDGLRDKRWIPAIAGGYIVAFAFLTLALLEGLSLGVAYGIWAATGIALTAIIARLAFGDPLTKTAAGGIALIGAGVLLVELGGH